MRLAKFLPAALSVLVLALSLSNFAKAATQFVTFDRPGAIYTVGLGMNAYNQIVGNYYGSDNVQHSFLWTPNGSLTNIDPPNSTQATAVAINGSGDIIGYYADASGLWHGFVRDAAGSVTTIDVAGATGGTFPEAINASGEVAGQYFDSSTSHSFVRDASGNITTFDPSGSIFSGALSINDKGVIVGTWEQVETPYNAFHGYERDQLGDITSYDVPGTGTGNGSYTEGGYVNKSGEIAGTYITVGGAYRGYVRSISGAFATFGLAKTQGGYGMFIYGINDSGEAAGIIDQNGSQSGLIREPNGDIVSFNDPDAGTGKYEGTQVYSISGTGSTTGVYVDANLAAHGFIRY